ncbi:Branched-chain alpha-ketoacid dehydrogenase kinase/Pyruvate dehydrogenase kinase N-terminal [Penicillium hordei]|uniref:Branched-chain alpha-ketoacid dehydrogenase kinase/Pyruvate dehydrogenase kinase N-terminal n=1 Tax=Penicillium hordei TaxID=40994 RepID=A0AAD6H4B3_9EURO|nr:Branched-chain alpha-ketoacid dehydrogenase kinase/Pyruvate dehydrogenase kinase N-terminal [Penicillium hordei]KAJ5602529.1 Branched-chain alpha-ketoacid dehydrogenase kinase/Pyruvate dehydrogenase kinase N-terminal [Penicillium hordei]
MVSSSKSASRLPQPYHLVPFQVPSRDVVAKIKMKHLNSPAGDNIPIYIFILLFAIVLSFLATTDFRPRSVKREQ